MRHAQQAGGARASAELCLLGGLVSGCAARLKGAAMPQAAAALAATAAATVLLQAAHVVGPVPASKLRTRADSGLLFGVCGLPCLWSMAACQIQPAGRAPLLQQFWLALMAGLGILIWLVGLTIRYSNSTTAPSAALMLLAAAARAVATDLGDASLATPYVTLQLACFVGVCSLLWFLALRQLPRCFTLGEAAFMAIGGGSVLHGGASTLVPSQCVNWVTGSMPLTILAMLCTATLVSINALLLLPFGLRPRAPRGDATLEAPRVTMLYEVVAVAVVAYGPWLAWVLRGQQRQVDEGLLLWLVNLVQSDKWCMQIIAYWAAILLIVPVIPRIQRCLGLGKTCARKLFHAVALAMFVPATALHVDLMALAFAVALNVFVWVEALRVCNLLPFRKIVSEFLGRYVDSRDQGPVILTHMYLLLGCAIPVWCHVTMCTANSRLETTSAVGRPHSGTGPLAFGGLLAVGVLDSLAAGFGKAYGRHRWPGTLKTVEGTAAAIVGSVGVVFVCSSYHNYSLSATGGGNNGATGMHTVLLEPVVSSWAQLCLPVVLIGLLEAFTEQIDNILLPVTYTTCFLALGPR